MNLIAAADSPLATRTIYFLIVFIATTWLTLYTIVKSKRLSDMLDALSDDRLSMKEKTVAMWRAWIDRSRA
jgi:hypothetical protein